ncbi:MAG TPA: methyltransferase domain-containing protein [Rhizomicrobium sp.]|nr:methyltransferase domain-containing protein [Rhizomicrobium sp.]
MTGTADDHYFSERALRDWTVIAEKHRLRDECFLRALAKYFRPGPILEIGAATGHLSEILKQRGHDVTASDVSPRFVAAIAARGVPAKIVDATGDIHLQAGRRFANVLAQNVIPLIRRNRDTLFATLKSIHAALEPSGRLICINARTARCQTPEAFFHPREQADIMRSAGLFRVVRIFPHQVVPTGWYKPWNAALFNLADFHLARIAAVRLVSVMEKIG